MGKTPKKAAPEGDERNRYVRRLKTASASSKHDDITANLTAARSVQPEYENTNRGKLTSNVQKSLKAAGSSKTFKSKLRSPVVKSSLNRLPKSTTSKPISSEKEASKAGITAKVFKQKTLVMQPKSDESEVELESQTTENVGEEYVSEDTIVIIKSKKIDTIESSEIIGDDKKNEATEAEPDGKLKDDEESRDKIVEPAPEIESVENQSAQLKVQLNTEGITQLLENDDSKEETEEHEAKLNLTIEDSPLKINLKEELNGSDEPEAIEEELQLPAEPQKENGHVADEKDDQNEDPADTESCSVDVVESTTSEVSEASEPAQIEPEETTAKEIPAQLAKDDVSFVSFDASIMLKDVQVRLNDCLKDNSQLFEVTNEERSISEPACKDSSFGRTLRNISGRHSINRMRHVTVRSRLSPNSSLYVNMSSVSLPDEDIRDHKILRHRTGLSSTLTCNGTPAERKRKREHEVSSDAKKVKTESESSLFNTSIGILQGLRRPIQVSTPNVGAYKFKPEKLDISGIVTNDDKVVAQEESGIAKKWCNIM